jgi:hypothetical protein
MDVAARWSNEAQLDAITLDGDEVRNLRRIALFPLFLCAVVPLSTRAVLRLDFSRAEWTASAQCRTLVGILTPRSLAK